VAATLARKAVLAACQQLGRQGAPDAEKLQRALDLLGPPFAAQSVAQTYDLVREVRKGCAPNCDELPKFASLATREVLILGLCATAGSMSDIGFESALEHAFARQLGPEVRSQLHLTRSAICRLGRDRNVFDKPAPKTFSSTLSWEELQAMFTAYAGACHSIASPSGASKASQRAKKRRKKTQKAQAAEDVARVEARDAESANQTALWRRQITEPWRLEPQWLNMNERAETMAALFCQARSHDASVPPGAFHQQEMEWIWTPDYEGYFYAEVPASEDGGDRDEEVLGDYVRL